MSENGQIEIVPLAQIATRKEWQVRHRLDDSAITRYATQYRNGADLAPITLTKVDGALCVIDGWHRLHAAIRVGLCSLPAKIVTTTPQEALWMAAEANLQHGVPLKKKEHRKVFRAFVKAGKHKHRKRLLSFREIADALHGIAAHTTIQNWMRRDFPTLAACYSSDAPRYAAGDIGPTWGLGNRTWEEAQGHINSLRAIHAGLNASDAEVLKQAIGEALGFIEPIIEPTDF